MGSPLISKKEEELPATREDFMKMKAAFDQLGYDVHTRQTKEATVNSVDDLMKHISLLHSVNTVAIHVETNWIKKSNSFCFLRAWR